MPLFKIIIFFIACFHFKVHSKTACEDSFKASDSFALAMTEGLKLSNFLARFGANTGSFDKLRAKLYPKLSTSHIRTTPLRRLSGRSVDEAEEILKFGKVVKVVETELLKRGINRPLLVTLEDGTKAVWKPRRNKWYSNYRAEVLAYELDRKFGFNLVPPTVERIIRGKKGSLQLFREHTLSPSPVPEKTKQDLVKQDLFDILIENTDRYKRKNYFIPTVDRRNWLMSPEGNIISIDNGIGFTGIGITGEKGIFRMQVHLHPNEMYRFQEHDESKTIIENMRSSLTAEFEEEIADYLGEEDAADLMQRMRIIINVYDIRNQEQIF